MSPMLRRHSHRRRGLRTSLGLLSMLLAAWAVGLIWFATALDRGLGRAGDGADGGRADATLVGGADGSVAYDTTTRTQAIVVLTGGSERLAAGFELLAADMGDKLFISGVYRGVDVRDLMRMSRQVPGDLECCIVLGHDAVDTEGNAVETARWMREEGYGSLRLVTANYHMPRSLVEFRRAMPDAVIIPHPVAPPNVRLDRWYAWPGTAELIVGEYTKFLLATARAILLGSRQDAGAAGAPPAGGSVPTDGG